MSMSKPREAVNVTRFEKRVFVVVIKLRILKMRVSWIFGLASNPVTRVLRRDTGRSSTCEDGGGGWSFAAEDSSSHQKLEDTRKGSTQCLQREHSLGHLHLAPLTSEL